MRSVNTFCNEFLKQQGEDPATGLTAVRKGLRHMEDYPHWDIIEFLVKRESVDLAYHLLRPAIGSYLPARTQILISDRPYSGLDINDPCIVIHSFNGCRGQLNAISEGIIRTRSFLATYGIGREIIERSRILTIVSTGRSTRNQIFSRSNDKLLMPGPKGSSPILMLIGQSYQLNLPCPGRWICNNDGIFLLSKRISFSGEYLGIMGGELAPLPEGCITQWKGQISSIFSDRNNMFIDGFNEIPENTANIEHENFSLGVYFVPHRLAAEFESLAPLFPNRNLCLVFDIVLPYLLSRKEWLRLSYRNGNGHRSHEVWDVTSRIRNLFPKVEFISGGERIMFRHIGSDQEYLQFVEEVKSSYYLKAFLNLAATISYQKSVLKALN